MMAGLDTIMMSSPKEQYLYRNNPYDLCMTTTSKQISRCSSSSISGARSDSDIESTCGSLTTTEENAQISTPSTMGKDANITENMPNRNSNTEYYNNGNSPTTTSKKFCQQNLEQQTFNAQFKPAGLQEQKQWYLHNQRLEQQQLQQQQQYQRYPFAQSHIAVPAAVPPQYAHMNSFDFANMQENQQQYQQYLPAVPHALVSPPAPACMSYIDFANMREKQERMLTYPYTSILAREAMFYRMKKALPASMAALPGEYRGTQSD